MEQEKTISRGGISSFGLHILAMALMLGDHLWATLIPGSQWLTWLGRLSFPIFAFCIVEGYCHTRNFKKYMLRLLACAIASEVPFNLMVSASWIFPFQQNVIWTFLISLLCIRGMEKAKSRWNPWLAVPAMALLAATCALAAMLTMTDYNAYGVLTVLLFYLFRGNTLRHRLGQLLGMLVIHGYLMGGQIFQMTLFGLSLELPMQALAVLALIPIWCYRGRQGSHNRAIQCALYAFYPVHMLILGLLSM